MNGVVGSTFLSLSLISALRCCRVFFLRQIEFERHCGRQIPYNFCVFCQHLSHNYTLVQKKKKNQMRQRDQQIDPRIMKFFLSCFLCRSASRLKIPSQHLPMKIPLLQGNCCNCRPDRMRILIVLHCDRCMQRTEASSRSFSSSSNSGRKSDQWYISMQICSEYEICADDLL